MHKITVYAPPRALLRCLQGLPERSFTGLIHLFCHSCVPRSADNFVRPYTAYVSSDLCTWTDEVRPIRIPRNNEMKHCLPFQPSHTPRAREWAGARSERYMLNTDRGCDLHNLGRCSVPTLQRAIEI